MGLSGGSDWMVKALVKRKAPHMGSIKSLALGRFPKVCTMK